MINKKLLFLLCLLACEKDHDGETIFTSDELLSYESEQHTQVFEPNVSSNNKLDILLVIDNSYSMEGPQQKLATNLEPLLEYIGDSDWRIAITSTDVRNVIYSVDDAQKFSTRHEFVKTITRENQGEFKEAIENLGISGGRNEAVLWKAIQALKGNYLQDNDLGLQANQIDTACFIENSCVDLLGRLNEECPCLPLVTQCRKREHWLRDGSTLAILLVTDEDHQCHDRAFGCTINDFYFYLKSIREPGATARVYGLLSDDATPDENTVPGNNRFINWKDPSGEESLFSKGKDKGWASIYDRDYTETLRNISKSIASSIKKSFTLEHAYDDKGETSVVFIKSDGTRDDLAKGQYSIKGKTLDIIKTIPNDIEKIEVTYSYGK